MSYEFVVSDVIPASPQRIYDAWLNSASHAAMTGGQPARISDKAGASFTAWNNYISGANLELIPGKRIVQSWRTTQFTDKDPDSRISVVLEPVEGGTRVTLTHSNVPDGHRGYQDGGWQKNYFDPMKKYFSA